MLTNAGTHLIEFPLQTINKLYVNYLCLTNRILSCYANSYLLLFRLAYRSHCNFMTILFKIALSVLQLILDFCYIYTISKHVSVRNVIYTLFSPTGRENTESDIVKFLGVTDNNWVYRTNSVVMRNDSIFRCNYVDRCVIAMIYSIL